MDLGALVRRLVGGSAGSGDGASPAVEPSSAAAGASAAGGGDGVSERPRGAWRDLPPVQRRIGAAPLIAPNAAFKAHLPMAQPAPLALAPLGHERRLEAPAGLVTGIAAPVQRAVDRALPAPRAHARDGARVAVQREAAVWPVGAAAERLGVAAETSAVPTIQAERESPDATLTAVLDHSLHETRTSGRPPAVSAASPFVTAPDPLTGLTGLVGATAVSSRPSEASAAPAASIRLPSPASRVAPLVSRAASPAALEGTIPRSPTADAAAAGDAARGPAEARLPRRIRVGAPLTPTVSRLVVPDAPGTPELPAPARAEAPAVAAAGAGASSAVEGSDAITLGTVPTTLPADVGHAGAEASDAAPVRLQRSAEDAVPTRPLVGGLRPVLQQSSPAIAVSRAAVSEAPPASDSPTPPPSGPVAALAALSRADPSAGPGAPWSGDGPIGAAPAAWTTPGPFAIEPATPDGTAPARLTWTHPDAQPPDPAGTSAIGGISADVTPAMPPVQRELATPSAVSRIPGEANTIARPAARPAGLRVGPAMGTDVWRVPAPAASPLGSRPIQRAAAGSSAASPRTPASPSVAVANDAPTVSRAVTIEEMSVSPVAGGASEAGGASAQPGEGPGSGPAGGAAPAASGAGTSAGGPGGSEAARDQETQVWADRLYDRIALRLRRDLLVERERAGALVDRGF